MKKTLYFALALFCALTVLSSCCTSPKAPVSVAWSGDFDSEKDGYFRSEFTITNISSEELGGDWAVYYSQLPRGIVQDENAPVIVEDINANFLRLRPSEAFEGLAPGESVQVVFHSRYGVSRNAEAPEGVYWTGADGQPRPVEFIAAKLTNPTQRANYPDAAKIYEANLRVQQRPELRQSDIIPSVKSAQPLDGEAVSLRKVRIEAEDGFASEAGLLSEKLRADYGITVSEKADTRIVLKSNGKEATLQLDKEAYSLRIGDGGIVIEAADAHGVFNGTQTLLAMLHGAERPYELEPVHIEDRPDLEYRGVMIDIVRNFTQVEDLKRLLDLFAQYKINVLHFHCTDDEGWRLDIPGLEELTEVGSRRGHTTDESECLYPGYDGGYEVRTPSLGSGYYTREQFIDLLQYAAARHITVIPEIETPGHARAALRSMEARYRKYIDTDSAKAVEYLLTEWEDSSVYTSAQYYHDNVLNPAMPATYRFIEKVAVEVAAMYKEAGVELRSIHLGGDEVAYGAWSKSPLCLEFMKEQGFTRSHDLAEHFITTITGILAQHDIRVSGWQEVGLGHSPEGHKLMTDRLYSVNCWTGQSNYERHYRMAESGVPVVMSCVSNFYMDMAYNGHPDEYGLNWGGYVDEATSFSMLPFDVYRSVRINSKGDAVDLVKAGKDKLRLTPEGAANIIGVSGHLFSETIRSFDMIEYYLFPKMMGLADRGWNAHPAWEAFSVEEEPEAEAAAFNSALALYYEVISRREMPFWKSRDVDFRVPLPGLDVKDGLLYANCAIDGAQIRYTTDGSIPTATSPLWTAPVAVSPDATITAKTFYLGRESLEIAYNNSMKN